MFKNTITFFRNQTANIIITLIGGLLPLFFEKLHIVPTKNISWEIGKDENFIYQSILVLITLYVLIRIRVYVVKDIEKSKEQIKQYIKKNCGLKLYDREKTAESSFQIVQETVSQFFITWLIVWLMWLVYYGGGLFISLGIRSSNNMVLTTYQQIFDFLNSTGLFAIYFILTNVTVNRKERNHNDYFYYDPILAWVILFIVFIAGVFVENCSSSLLVSEITSFYVSAISTITFVLLLGKMNSSYLKIPALFMLVLYIYAITQLYVPIKELKMCIGYNCWLTDVLKYSLPYITLIGKIVLMLTICWIAVQRRFIFFIIHRSTTIDKSDDLLSELNKENVSF